MDGRDSAAAGSCLAAPSAAWRAAVEVVAIDRMAAFRRALREQLLPGAVSVDAFHLVKLGRTDGRSGPAPATGPGRAGR